MAGLYGKSGHTTKMQSSLGFDVTRSLDRILCCDLKVHETLDAHLHSDWQASLQC